MPDEIITGLRIEVAELRTDVKHLTDTIDLLRGDFKEIKDQFDCVKSESDQRKTLDKLIIVALTGGVSATVSWVMSLRGGLNG